MKNIAQGLFLVSVCFVLAACSGSPEEMEMPTEEDSLRADGERITGEHSLLLHTDFLGYHHGETVPDRVHVECKNKNCFLGFTPFRRASGNAFGDGAIDISKGPNGIRMAERRHSSVTRTIHVRSGWMQHSFFVSEAVLLGDIIPDPGTVRAASYALGMTTGINPTVPEGGATWRGAVLGRTAGVTESLQDIVQGEATIVVDPGSPDFLQADVAFTQLQNLRTEQAYSDIGWNNLDIKDGGFARRDSESDNITGQFFGPEQEEVAGTFERSGITGAFGARLGDGSKQ